MMTVGPWKDVRLETYSYRFEDVRIDSDLVAPEYNKGTLRASVTIGSRSLEGARVKATLRGKTTVVKEDTLSLKQDLLDWELKDIAGWYPRGYGEQPLYDLDLVLLDKVGTELGPS